MQMKQQNGTTKDDRKILEERAQALAQPLKEPTRTDKNAESFVIFSLAGKRYGISSKFVKVSMIAKQIIEIIKAPKHIRGLVRIEGRTVPLVYLPYFWHPESDVISDTDYLILISTLGMNFALMVNHIESVIKIAPEEISMPPQTIELGIRKTLTGITKDDILIIDAEQLVNSEGFAISRPELDN